MLFDDSSELGIGTTTPSALVHLQNNHSQRITLKVQGITDQSVDLTQWLNSAGNTIARITQEGKMVFDNSAGHLLELRPSGDTGYLSSSGGAVFIENSNNIGTGIGIYSNAGEAALGNMINVKVDNPLYAQAAFYMNYDGISNAVEIVSNTNDSSSNALSITNNNTQDSALGVIGYETGKGTIKVSHNGTGSDANASGISIDLKGTGTRAQGLYIDSTASGGTTGNLLRLRNETIDRFVVDSLGGVKIGSNGTNTSVTKYGNTVGDEFFVGTNAAFRVQRSATDSEAFRTQVVGDVHGRWLGTADGKLKFGSGAALQDIVMERIASGHMSLDATEFSVTGNLGIGTTTFDATADNVLTFGNATAPAASIADGVQLWAEDVASSSELRVRNEAGAITTLSPHNFTLIPGGPSESMAWSHYSVKDDIAINADITHALRLVENLTGEKLVYTKNLATNEDVVTTPSQTQSDIYSQFGAIADEKIALALEEYVTKAELYSHATLGDKIWEFLSDVTFRAKALFTQSVEFLADATFRGSITVSARTSGEINVPANTKSFKISFDQPLVSKPVVYVNTLDTQLEYRVSEISESGFRIDLVNPTTSDTAFQWLALLSTEEGASFAVLESSQQQNNVEVEVETIPVEDILVVEPSPEPSEEPIAPANLPE